METGDKLIEHDAALESIETPMTSSTQAMNEPLATDDDIDQVVDDTDELELNDEHVELNDEHVEREPEPSNEPNVVEPSVEPFVEPFVEPVVEPVAMPVIEPEGDSIVNPDAKGKKGKGKKGKGKTKADQPVDTKRTQNVLDRAKGGCKKTYDKSVREGRRTSESTCASDNGKCATHGAEITIKQQKNQHSK